MDKIIKPVSYYLEKLMREQGINKKQLSEILKVNASTITRLLNGEIALNCKMALHLGIYSNKKALTWMNYQVKWDLHELRNQQEFKQTKLTKKSRKASKDGGSFEEW